MENRMENRISFMENFIFMENVCHFMENVCHFCSKKDPTECIYCKNWKCVSFLKQEPSY